MEYPKAAPGVDHRTTPEHHDNRDLTFPYRTMGIPTPGQKFNFTPVPRDKLYKYDEQFMELFEPYNVKLYLFRTQIASMPGMVLQVKVDMLSAKTSWGMLKE